MKDIVKSAEEFEYGEYYYIRRKINLCESVGEYSWIWTRLDCDNIGVIDCRLSGNKYKLLEYTLGSGIFAGLEILDFERIQNEYHKLWITQQYKFLGVYINERTIETKKNVLYLRDQEIPIGSRFFGLSNFLINFERIEDSSLGIVNRIKDPSDLFLNFETDILGRYSFWNTNGQLFRIYCGCIQEYKLAIPWDDDLYENVYLPHKLGVLKLTNNYQHLLL